MQLKRILISLISITIFLSILSMPVSANTIDSHAVPQSTTESVDPRIDVIVTKYRETIDGRLQYRRWNETRGYWVDPYWMYVPEG